MKIGQIVYSKAGRDKGKALSVISDKLLNEEIDAIVLEKSYLTLAYEEIKDFEDSIKIIDTFTIKAKVYKENNEEKITFDKPFVINGR